MGCAICENPAFIFTHIPKTGGTSFLSSKSLVAKGLSKHCKGLKIMDGHRRLISLAATINLDKYFKFSIVRNPYDRFISLWLTKVKYLTLDNFIESIKQRKLGWYPLKTQSSLISNKKGKVLTDCLIRYEKYSLGINKVLNKLGLPKPLSIQHLRKTEREKDYKVYYKKKAQIDFVTKQYAIDLKNFNYQF